MAGKRVLLTLNSAVYDELKIQARDNLMTLQEYISDVLRKDVLKTKKSKGGFRLKKRR